MTSPKLAKNALYLTLASIGQKVIAFVYFTIIARYIGVEDTGAYFLSLAVVMMLSVVDDLGITPVIIREIARKTEDAKIWCRTVVGIKMITMPATVVMAYFIPIMLGYDAEVTLLIRVAVAIMLADTLSLSFYGVLRGLQNLKYESLGIFIGQLITAGLGIAFMVTGIASLPLLIVALVAGSSWNMIYSATRMISKLGIGALVPTWTLGWKPLKIAFAFFLAAVFVKVYSYVDSIILSLEMGKEAVGVYAVAYKFTYAFQFLPLAFVAALYPTMSAEANDPEQLKKTFINALWYMSLIGAPIVFGIWSLAPELISAFYGADFNGSILPLQVLIFVLIPIFLDFPTGSLLNATDRQNIKTSIMGVTMIINIVANLILIPRFGVVGASISGLLSFSFLFIAGWSYARKVVNLRFFELVSSLWGLFASAALMALVVILVKPFVHFVLAILVGAVVFIALSFLFRAITKDHVKSLYRLFKRKPYVEGLPPNA
ncbi:MAG: flippase [Candidatus Uhrbacteria bacterium]|nr:flippase [Candidatus Uhrbacteria bacterium]